MNKTKLKLYTKVAISDQQIEKLFTINENYKLLAFGHEFPVKLEEFSKIGHMKMIL